MIEKLNKKMLLQGKDDPLASQRLELIFQNYSLAFWSGLLISAVPVLALWMTVSHAVLLGWMLALWGELAVRYVYARRYSCSVRGADVSKWRTGMVVIAVIDGAFWGLSVWVFAASPTDPATMFVLLVIACVAVFDSRELAAVPLAATLCLLATLLPVALWMFSFGAPLTTLMGIAMLGYFGLLLIFSRHTYHSICRLLSSTEKSLALAAAQMESEQRMARYFDSAPGYFFTLEHRSDGRNAITFASPGIRELFGLEPETVMRDFSAFIAITHPEDVGMVFSKAEDSRRNLIPYNIEYRIIHPQKGVRWFEVKALPQRLADGGTRWDGFMHDITERKRMEEEIRRSAEFQNSLLVGIRDSGTLVVVIENGRVIYFGNRDIAHQLGFSDEAIAAHPNFIDVVHPDDRDWIIDMYRRRLNGEPVPPVYELGLMLPDGSRREYEVAVSVVPDTNPLRSIHILRDITERKRMEESLRAREKEYRTLAENFPDVVIRYGRDYRRIYVNPAFEELAGGKVSDLVGRSPQEASPLLDMNAYMAEMRKAMECGIASSRALPVRRVNGEEGWYMGSFVPEFDAGGKVSGVLMVARDITERIRMEQALQESEAQYRQQHNLLHSIFESPTKIGIYALDREYRYLAFNNLVREGAKRIWGTDIVVGMSMLDDAIQNDDAHRAFCKQGFDYVLAGNNFYIESKEAKVKDGVTVYEYHDNYSSPIYDDKGEVIGLTVFVTDTTERKQTEHKLEEYRAQLRGLLAQRESAREEERKLIARDVHDDLGQILTGLKINLAVMGRKYGADSPPLLELIQGSKELMDSAINSVRNISSALRPVELDMGIVTAISWHAGRFSAYTGIPCAVHMDEEIPLDENRAVALFRIVQEALTNIAKHAQASRVSVSLMRDADDYVLKVCDNGSGFDVNLKKDGSFGLVGMRERVLMLGGTLSINSNAGEGTELVVRFPVPVQNISEKL
jgi:PAS domain S-box-containing protein